MVNSKRAHGFSWIGAGLLVFLTGGAALAAPTAAPDAVSQGTTTLAFPGAQGWAAQTPGGRGGKVLRVTTLAASGAGFVSSGQGKDLNVTIDAAGMHGTINGTAVNLPRQGC